MTSDSIKHRPYPNYENLIMYTGDRKDKMKLEDFVSIINVVDTESPSKEYLLQPEMFFRNLRNYLTLGPLFKKHIEYMNFERMFYREKTQYYVFGVKPHEYFIASLLLKTEEEPINYKPVIAIILKSLTELTNNFNNLSILYNEQQKEIEKLNNYFINKDDFKEE